MVEFKVKTQANQDTTLHASYPDLYDGTSPYLKVGGDNEPKKSLIRFTVAEKPTYGDAILKGGEVGFYATGLTAASSSFPTFNMYKLKTGPNDANAWSGDGRIRTVNRGKQIVGITTTNEVGGTDVGSFVTVLNHGLNTGDRINHSPYTNQYNDVLLAGITAEKEYFVIRIDRDTFAFATSIDNAQANTRVELVTYSSTGLEGGPNYVPAAVPAAAAAAAGGPWGYIRSEIYSQDIHIVTAKPKNSETISENFDGSAYRTSDLGFETISRSIIRKTNPHVTRGQALWDKPEGTTRAQGEEGAWRGESNNNLKQWYGEEQSGGGYKIYLTDYESNSDGTGWWETEKDAGKWKGGYEYAPKTLPPTSLTPNPNVKYDKEEIESTTAYGDEVTPANSFFHVVKGASEYSSAPPEGDGDNVLDATGAIRFSTKVKKTGAQACNMYSFWKKTATDVKYLNDRQESHMVYKGLPMPTVNFGNIEYSVYGHGMFPIASSGADHVNLGTSDWTLSMKINFKKLEKAYAIGTAAAHDTITARRGFHVILASSAPRPDENFYDYCHRLSNNGSWKSAADDEADGHGVGFSIINTDTHMKIFNLEDSVFDTTNKDITWTGVYHDEEVTTGPGRLSGITESEWYDIKVVIPPTTNAHAMLVIENGDEQNVTRHAVEQTGAVYHEESAQSMLLTDFGNSGIGDPYIPGLLYGQDTFNNAGGCDWWYQHLSIWCTNTVSNYSSTAGSGEGTDWMAGAEDRDTTHNIFIDSISLHGVNMKHANATIGQVGRTGRSKIAITSETYESSYDYSALDVLKYNKKGDEDENSIRRADNIILLGFEDPSQIASAHDIEPSWRYLFWNGYSSANLGSDNKITFTAGDTLPATTGIQGNGSVVSQPVTGSQWFNAIGSVDTGIDWWKFETTSGESSRWSRYWYIGDHNTNIGNAAYADAGMPIAYSEYTEVDSPTSVAFYSDAHHTSGASISDEVLNVRNLYLNRTKDINDTADGDDSKGQYGSQQPMFSMCPSIGAIFRPDGDGESTAISGGVISLANGPLQGRGQYWKTGHPVVYYNNENSSSHTNLNSATGTFKDNPTNNATGKYWVIRIGTGDSGVDNRTFKLAASEALALAGTALSGDAIPAYTSGNSGNHILYDYDYYTNRKYFIDGFSSKGLSRMILQPMHISAAGGSTTFAITQDYLSNDGSNGSKGFMAWDEVDHQFEAADGHATDTTTTTGDLMFTKREHMSCAAKVLEVIDKPSPKTIGTITLRVDTTEPLYSVVGTKYRLFLLAANGTSSYASDMTISIIDKENIQVHNWNGESDSGTVMWNTVGTDDAKDTTLSRLWIGPEKYWVGFIIRNQSGYSASTIGTLPNKTYDSICIVSPSGAERVGHSANSTGFISSTYPAWGTPGATYSESTYNADKVSGIRGAYINQWKPSPNLDPNETIYDLQDYGYGGPAEDKESSGVENAVLGGYAARFVPRTGQINKVKIPALFNTGNQKEEGDSIDMAIQAENANNPSVMSIASIDNNTYPKPFLLTVFEDELPEAPVDLEVEPNEEDAFLPEFTWTAGDSDLWYGFIIIDDRPINNQYHHSLLHIPLNEDLRTVASLYDDTKGHYYASTTSPVIYGHRYENTTVTPSGVHAGTALASAGTEKVSAVGVSLYDNEEGLAGNTKYFTSGSYAEFNYHTTATSSDFSYPIDEMSVLVHITPTSWGANRYIASFNISTDTTTTKDSWGIYLDANGQINAFVSASDNDYTTHQTTHIELKSTTKAPIDGTPTSIILSVDTQLHSGNVKLYINGRLEDQTGLRGTLSINNWPTDATGKGGHAIFQLKNASYDESLFIGAKAQNGSSVGQNSFEGKIEEFVWYDKCIYPVTPQDGKFTLEKPIKELVTGSASASSKAYTARLFIKDYHNIRGKTSGEVAASSQVSFKKAAFSLYT